MSVKNFHVDQRETETEQLFYISGELDLAVASHFRSALEPVVNKAGKPLILDLENLNYIDSTGIGILISVLKLREELNAEFFVRNIPPGIKRLLDLTGVSGFLKERSDGGV